MVEKRSVPLVNLPGQPHASKTLWHDDNIQPTARMRPEHLKQGRHVAWNVFIELSDSHRQNGRRGKDARR